MAQIPKATPEAACKVYRFFQNRWARLPSRMRTAVPRTPAVATVIHQDVQPLVVESRAVDRAEVHLAQALEAKDGYRQQ